MKVGLLMTHGVVEECLIHVQDEEMPVDVVHLNVYRLCSNDVLHSSRAPTPPCFTFCHPSVIDEIVLHFDGGWLSDVTARALSDARAPVVVDQTAD